MKGAEDDEAMLHGRRPPRLLSRAAARWWPSLGLDDATQPGLAPSL